MADSKTPPLVLDTVAELMGFKRWVKAFVRGPPMSKACEIPSGVQVELQRLVLQHWVLWLLPRPQQEDRSGDTVLKLLAVLLTVKVSSKLNAICQHSI